MDLGRGANTGLSGGPLEISVAGVQPGTVDLLVFQLGAEGAVRREEDLVFFNQPRSPEGAVELVGGDRVRVDLAAVPADVTTLAVAVALDDGVAHPLGQVAGLGATVTDGAATHTAPASGLGAERAALLVEVYRRGDGWKVRSVSAGWAEGLASLVTHFGVAVADDEPATPTAAAAPAPPPPAPPTDGPRSVPGEERVSLEKRQRLDLRKREVHKVLLEKGAATQRARVILVIDKTGSMKELYATKAIHRVVERMVPVAVQLDDDGALEAYLYARGHMRLPDLHVADLDTWADTHLHLKGIVGGVDYNAIGHGNDEIPIMTAVLDDIRPDDPTPTLVLFFTDGGFAKRAEIAELVRTASSRPAFWQFVGLGKAKYGVLERLDELEGRVVDNVGFFAVDDIDAVDDAELYRRLLGEFPDWLVAARAAGIVPR
ncbi:stress protein [Iamia sp. SCSIO 61187]|uniref:VWA domain-containing protein n=1 Tax=Iamia sp. SCSIO 61187 TaxID=2722752 RepID=UPI001C63A714|nr:VWA domain-containing protein [Iamia sp. SCSIO 61187]QYG93275.1 stress protein [Iamia sp. SCSIO 61187]